MTILDGMVRRRRFKAAYLLGSLLLLAASLHPPTAYSAPGDPPSGSPAGAVYQLPLEQGRSDAAPKGNGGTGAEPGGSGGGTAGSGAAGAGSASEGTGESSSLYRSENNFGSSSRVPGVAAAGGGPGSMSGGAAGGGQGGAAGTGSAAIAAGVVAAETADTGNTSIPASIVLLGAIALLAIAVGVLSRRYARHAGTSN